MTGAVVSLLGIRVYLTSDPTSLRFALIQGRERPYLTFDDPNNYATFVAGILPLAFALLACNRRKFSVWLLALVVITGALMCALSRAAWLGTAGGIFVTVLILRKKAVVALCLFTAILLAEGLFFTRDVRSRGTMAELGTVASVEQIKGQAGAKQLEDTARQRGVIADKGDVAGQSQAGAQDESRPHDGLVVLDRGTDSYRLTLIKLSLAMARENPILGVGLGNSGKTMGQYFSKIGGVSLPFYSDYEQKNVEMTPHIALLHIAAEVGLIGVVVFVLFVLGFYYSMSYLLTCENRNEDFVLTAGLVGGWTTMLITTSFGWIFVRGSAELFFILAGLTIACKRAMHSDVHGAPKMTAEAVT
jgi:hypothetical protein